MPNWRVVFRVDGRRSEQIVAANSSLDAKKLIEMQYSGHKVIFITVTRV